jgi:hypothetical protein
MIHLKEFNLKKKLDINLYPKKEQTTLTTRSISLKVISFASLLITLSTNIPLSETSRKGKKEKWIWNQ